ncbi:MAG: J domain-containing protein [Chloroflexota bacterium]|nr:J domain-containing protein [Chloroflexota bacterium]
MPDAEFRGDPYRVLDVTPDASNSTIKRRWRELAREHHPDRAAGDGEEATRLTGRMARINAAYDLLRDPIRRARFDQSPDGQRSRSQARRSNGRATAFGEEPLESPAGPPPPPPSRPVTARFDTTSYFRPRNTTLDHAPRTQAYGPGVRQRVRPAEPDELRASSPSGPVERRQGARPLATPSLREARETSLTFGKFRGYTLGEVELLEPSYIHWIAQTITRDRDVVLCARVIQAELERQGATRPSPPTASRSGSRSATG